MAPHCFSLHAFFNALLHLHLNFTWMTLLGNHDVIVCPVIPCPVLLSQMEEEENDVVIIIVIVVLVLLLIPALVVLLVPKLRTKMYSHLSGSDDKGSCVDVGLGDPWNPAYSKNVNASYIDTLKDEDDLKLELAKSVDDIVKSLPERSSSKRRRDASKVLSSTVIPQSTTALDRPVVQVEPNVRKPILRNKTNKDIDYTDESFGDSSEVFELNEDDEILVKKSSFRVHKKNGNSVGKWKIKGKELPITDLLDVGHDNNGGAMDEQVDDIKDQKDIDEVKDSTPIITVSRHITLVKPSEKPKRKLPVPPKRNQATRTRGQENTNNPVDSHTNKPPSVNGVHNDIDHHKHPVEDADEKAIGHLITLRRKLNETKIMQNLNDMAPVRLPGTPPPPQETSLVTLSEGRPTTHRKLPLHSNGKDMMETSLTAPRLEKPPKPIRQTRSAKSQQRGNTEPQKPIGERAKAHPRPPTETRPSTPSSTKTRKVPDVDTVTAVHRRKRHPSPGATPATTVPAIPTPRHDTRTTPHGDREPINREQVLKPAQPTSKDTSSRRKQSSSTMAIAPPRPKHSHDNMLVSPSILKGSNRQTDTHHSTPRRKADVPMVHLRSKESTHGYLGSRESDANTRHKANHGADEFSTDETFLI